VTSENFDKEGTLPVFILRVKDDSGNVSERKIQDEHADCAQGAGAGRAERSAEDGGEA